MAVTQPGCGRTPTFIGQGHETCRAPAPMPELQIAGRAPERPPGV